MRTFLLHELTLHTASVALLGGGCVEILVRNYMYNRLFGMELEVDLSTLDTFHKFDQVQSANVRSSFSTQHI